MIKFVPMGVVSPTSNMTPPPPPPLIVTWAQPNLHSLRDFRFLFFFLSYWSWNLLHILQSTRWWKLCLPNASLRHFIFFISIKLLPICFSWGATATELCSQWMSDWSDVLVMPFKQTVWCFVLGVFPVAYTYSTSSDEDLHLWCSCDHKLPCFRHFVWGATTTSFRNH